MVKMLDTYHKLSQQDMESFEAKINVELTNNYKTFLLKWNGGTPDPGVFVIPEWEGTTVMNYFYSIGDIDNDFEVYLDIYDLSFHAWLIAFGNDWIRYVILLSVSCIDYDMYVFCV